MGREDYGQHFGDQPKPIANEEAEAALLGALMIKNDLVDHVAELLTADDFHVAVHGRVYTSILQMVAQNLQANPVTLRPMFDNDPGLRDVGGAGYLAQLTGSGAAIFGAKDFAKQINEMARARRLFEAVEEMRQKVVRNGLEMGEAFKIAAAVEGLAYNAGTKTGEATRSFSIADSIDRVVVRVREIQDGGVAVGVIAPDIPEMEAIIGPLERKHMIVVAGRPGMGKSALMCSAARSQAAAGYGVGVISLEMGDIDLGQRFAADVALSYDEPIKHAAIRDAKLDSREIKLLDWCANQVRAMPLRLVDASGLTMARLAMKARQMKRELEATGHTLDVLYIDYLQLLHSDRSYDSKNAEVTQVSNGIKQLAKELNCAIVALAQLSRDCEKRDDKRPVLPDLRDSGSIEQDADTVCFVYREEYYLAQKEPDKHGDPSKWERWYTQMGGVRDEMELIVPKRRGGATGKKTTLFLRQYQAVRARNFLAEAPVGMFNNG